MRALRDRPDRGCKGATFRRRDKSALLAALDHRPSVFDPQAWEAAAAAAAEAAAAAGVARGGREQPSGSDNV